MISGLSTINVEVTNLAGGPTISIITILESLSKEQNKTQLSM
jgi:hypothetical protein